MLYINAHYWNKQSKSTRLSLIVPSESNDDLLEGQIFIHVTILLYLLIAKQGTCIFVWFLHFLSCLPKSTQQNAHLSTCHNNFTCTIYCLYASPAYSFDKDCFSDFCPCWTKNITTPVWWLQCCTISVLNWIPNQRVCEEPAE